MRPYKKSNGYAKDGTKLYRRFFVIEKINSKNLLIVIFLVIKIIDFLFNKNIYNCI